MRHWTSMAILGGLLAVAMTASARPGGGPMGGGPGGGGGAGGPGGGRAMRSGPLLQQLVFPCPADCHDAAKDCHDDTDETALACAAEACPAEITAAQTACAGDDASGCREAFATLRTCAESCLDTRQTALAACRDEAESCITACSTAE